MKTAKLRNAAPGSGRMIRTGTDDVLIIPETKFIFGLRPNKTLNVTDTILREKVELEPGKHLDRQLLSLVTSECRMSQAFILPSPAGEGPMLRPGLAAVGEEDVGVATVSTGAFPDWDDGMEDVPAEAPLILFCRGERGLCARNTIKTMMAAAAGPCWDNEDLFLLYTPVENTVQSL